MARLKGQLPPKGKRCEAIKADGERCRRDVWKGYRLCSVHQKMRDMREMEERSLELGKPVVLNPRNVACIGYMIESGNENLESADEVISWAFRHVLNTEGRGRWLMDNFGKEWRRHMEKLREYGVDEV